MGAALSMREGVLNVGLVPRVTRGKQLSAALRLASVGIELAVSTVVGMLGGSWLDKKLGTAPYLAIAGLCLGVVAGFRSLIATARKSLDKTASPTQTTNDTQPRRSDDD